MTASWWASYHTPAEVAGTAKGNSEFSIGQNQVTVGNGTTITGKANYAYQDGFKQMLVERDTMGGDPRGKAYSDVNPTLKNLDTKLYSYVMSADAYVYPTYLGPRVTATTNAADPQEIDLPGFFEQTITLGAGSSLYMTTEDLRDGSGLTTFELTAVGILNDPMASISLSIDLSGASVAVTFNPDARLQFFEPGTTTPISSGFVESLLLGNADLFSDDGLTVDLPLFTVSLDLSSSDIPPGAALGSQAMSTVNALAVPEPASLALSALGGLVVLSCARRLPGLTEIFDRSKNCGSTD